MNRSQTHRERRRNQTGQTENYQGQNLKAFKHTVKELERQGWTHKGWKISTVPFTTFYDSNKDTNSNNRPNSYSG